MKNSLSLPAHPRRNIWLAGTLIVATAVAIYMNSLQAPFVFDDEAAVIENPSIRQLWPLSVPLSPAANVAGAEGRPVVNLTLAINYAIGGLEVRGYRIFNILGHSLAGLALFGLIRRTLVSPACAERCGSTALPLSLGITLLWVAHPLHTESVISIQNRSEILSSLFYLLTLYGLARSAAAERPLPWHCFSVCACVLGMASKEIMVSAPLIAFVYDRTFFAGSFSEAWRKRRWLYCALASTWVLLAVLVIGHEKRSGSAGLGLGISSWDYLLTQCHAITLYLKLSFWPHPLVLDYGTAIVRDLQLVWPHALLLLTLAGLTAWALVKHPRTGWLGLSFFAILSPSSSVVPVITQTVAEHRMYLPLAAVIVLTIMALQARAGRWTLPWMAVVTMIFGGMTVRRNLDYHSALSIWTDTAAKQPNGWRPQLQTAAVLTRLNRFPEAEPWYKASIRNAPAQPEPHQWFAMNLAARDRLTEASKLFEIAARLQPNVPQLHFNWGVVQLKLGKPSEAVAQFRIALKGDPNFAEAYCELGSALEAKHDEGGALENFAHALRLRPNYTDAHFRLGRLRHRLGDAVHAAHHYEATLAHQPDHAAAQTQLGQLLQSESAGALVPFYQDRVRNDPSVPASHTKLAVVLASTNRIGEAIPHFRRVTELLPGDAMARANLGSALSSVGEHAEAITHYQEALRLHPGLEGVAVRLAEARRLLAEGNTGAR